MIVCPLCANPQAAGFECDVCGKDLSSAAGLDLLGPPPVAAIERLAGLEQTVPDRVGDVAVERLGGLEASAFERVDVKVALSPDIEPAAFAAVGDVPVAKLTDLADERAPDDGVRTAPLGDVVACRFCKDVFQAPGTLCEVCGYQLPKQLETLAIEVSVEDWLRCRSCGAAGPVGQRCSECGQMIEAAEA